MSAWLEATQHVRGHAGAGGWPPRSRARPEIRRSLLATLLLSPMPPSTGRARGGFLGCGPSLGHEVDFFRGPGAACLSLERRAAPLGRRCPSDPYVEVAQMLAPWGRGGRRKQSSGTQVCWARGPGSDRVSHGWRGRRAIQAGNQVEAS